MIKKQKTISLLLLVVLISLPLFFLSACGPTGNGDVAEEGDSQENGETFELKFATVVNSPHAWVDTANYFAEEVEKRTNGKVKTVVYPGGQLGDDETSADELRMGTVDLMIGGTSNITSFVPELQIFNLTYLFDNLEHQRHSIRFGGPLEKKYKEIFDEKGIGLKLLNLTVGGTRHFFNNKKPVVDPEDIKGIKMRTSGSPLSTKVWDSLGVISTSLSWNEIYSAMQTGLVDSFESTIGGYDSAKYYEVAPYLSLTEHVWMMTHITMSEKTYNNLPQEYVDIICEVADEAAAYGEKLTFDAEDDLLKKLETENGVKINECNKEKFVEATAHLQDELVKDFNGEELLRMIRDKE